MTPELTADPDQATAAPFGQVCALAELTTTDAATGRYAGTIDSIWTIGPKVHGGTMVAASAAAATTWLRTVDPERTAMAPIAASSDFLGAPEPGAVEYEVSVRKVGRQICLLDATLSQGGKAMVRTAFTFGHLDEADTPPAYAPSHTDMPAEPGASAIAYDPESPMGQIVHVAQGADLCIDSEWARFLASETGVPRLRLWMRPREGDQNDPDVSMYFAMMAADMSPPVPANLGNFGWAPTVQMTTYLRRRPAPGWLRIIATTHEVGGRMFDEDQLVIDSTGAVVAQSRQLALMPAPRR